MERRIGGTDPNIGRSAKGEGLNPIPAKRLGLYLGLLQGLGLHPDQAPASGSDSLAEADSMISIHNSSCSRLPWLWNLQVRGSLMPHGASPEARRPASRVHQVRGRDPSPTRRRTAKVDGNRTEDGLKVKCLSPQPGCSLPARVVLCAAANRNVALICAVAHKAMAW
jgi:hypothetical protein